MGAPLNHFRALACALLVAATWGAVAGPAQAEVRGVIAGDPQDAAPTVSGQPSNPDVGVVDVAYDGAGTLRITIDYFNPFGGLDTSQRYAYSARLSVGTAVDKTEPLAGCATDLDGQHHVYRPGSDTYFYDRATVAGVDGYLNFTRTVSPDQRRITLTATSPAIANRDWRCMTYTLLVRARSTASHPRSDYDSTCDCWYLPETLDTVGEDIGAGRQVIWFNGFRPVKPVTPPGPPAPPKVKTVKYSVKSKATLRGGKLKLTLNSGQEVIGRNATVTLHARSGKRKRYKKLGKARTWKVKKTTQSRTFGVSRRRKAVRVTVTVKGFTNKAALRKYKDWRRVQLVRRK